MTEAAPTAAELFARFDAPRPLTIGVEEEVMVLDPQTRDLAPRAAEALAAAGLGHDPRFKLELPASQLEILTPPAARIDAIERALWRARSDLAAGIGGEVGLAVAGAHPNAEAQGDLRRGPRLARLEYEYGPIARLQLICGLHVHVALAGADRVLAVHNALRAYLPELSALAGNAPFYGGQDTGMASVRPTICATLPRQGVPPTLATWEAFAEDLRWGLAADRLGGLGEWWWELRPHPRLGTIEIRVPDAQTTVSEAAAVAATVGALVVRLGERHDAGELPPPAPEWRIRENRWSAARHGVDGRMVDLETGQTAPTRKRLHALLDELASAAAGFAEPRHLERAHLLAERNGAIRQREVAAADGLPGLMDWLAGRFLREPGGG
ncbi:MAG: YbdK family carboxylate-amine ligase [Actinobacteria bacterium]|nr:YbdK family carboxylate-amine ligase [Actinomycetota bacterium]